MTLLLRTPAPHPSESLLGYSLRVSETNGYDSPWHVFSLANFRQSKMKSAGFEIDKLARVLGCSPEQLAPISYVSDGDKPNFKLLGHSLGRSLKLSPLRLKSSAICPRCIEENGFVDCFWDLSVATACPVHGTRPIRFCPSCQGELTWFRPGLLRCKCGASLAIEGDKNVPHAELQLMQLIYAKLHRYETPHLPSSTLPVAQLWALPLRTLIDLLLSTGDHVVNVGLEKKKHSRDALIAAATAFFDNWPQNFYSFLKDADQKSCTQGISIRKRFEGFYESMFKGRNKSPSLAFLKEELIRFGMTEWGEGLVDARMLTRENFTQRYVSRQQLAKLIGVDARTVSGWASEGKLSLKEVSLGSQVRFVADAEGFSVPITSDGAPTLHLREAAQQIGIPVSALRYLKNGRHYSPRHMPPFKKGFHPKDLDEFVQQLISLSTLLEESPIQSTLTLDYVMQEIRFWSDNGKGEFLVAFLRGEVQSVGRLGHQIATILFLKSDVENFARHSRAKASGGSISMKEAAKIIGHDVSVVADLVRAKFLTARLGPHRSRIERDSLHSFTTQYGSLQSVARDFSCPISRLEHLSDTLDLEITRIPKAKAGYSSFIRIEQREKLVEFFQAEQSSKRTSPIRALSDYLEGLHRNGLLLPRRSGRPNLLAIAKACGFERSAFYKNVAVQEMLSDYQLQEACRVGLTTQRTPIEALRSFLARLAATGDPLPLRGDRPNLRQIARSCGFKRDWFYASPELQKMLKAFHQTEEACN